MSIVFFDSFPQVILILTRKNVPTGQEDNDSHSSTGRVDSMHLACLDGIKKSVDALDDTRTLVSTERSLSSLLNKVTDAEKHLDEAEGSTEGETNHHNIQLSTLQKTMNQFLTKVDHLEN